MNTPLTARTPHARKTLGAAFVVAAIVLTSACGGGDDRPSKDDIVNGITKGAAGAISKKQADCAAKIVLDSDLSAEALQALADGDSKFKPSKADQAEETDLTEKLAGCLK